MANGDCSEKILKHCDWGCIEEEREVNGRTIKEAMCKQEGVFCRDSDKGLDYFDSGYAERAGGERKYDYCRGNTLHEFSCVGRNMVEKAVDCRRSFGMSCISGRCIELAMS